MQEREFYAREGVLGKRRSAMERKRRRAVGESECPGRKGVISMDLCVLWKKRSAVQDSECYGTEGVLCKRRSAIEKK